MTDHTIQLDDIVQLSGSQFFWIVTELPDISNCHTYRVQSIEQEPEDTRVLPNEIQGYWSRQYDKP